MVSENRKKQLLYNCFFLLIGFLIIYDYSYYDKIKHEKITKIVVQRDVPNHYNRSHNETRKYSYEIYTEHNNFYCSSDFAFSVNEGEDIIIYESALFSEVNYYEGTKNGITEHNTFREFYGFQFPLCMLIAIVISYLFLSKLYVIDFIAKVFLLVNLLYVII